MWVPLSLRLCWAGTPGSGLEGGGKWAGGRLYTAGE